MKLRASTLVAGEQDVELHEVARAVVGELVVQARVALGAALELVEEVQDELGERDVEVHLHGLLGEIDHILRDAAVLDGELHDRTRVLGRHDDLGLEVGLLDALDAGDVGKVLRAANLDHLAVGLVDVVVHRGRGAMSESANSRSRRSLTTSMWSQDHGSPTRKTESPRATEVCGAPRERGVVHAQLLQGVAQVLVVLVVHGEDAGVDHRLGLAVARQGLRAAAVAPGEGVAHAHGLGVLEARDNEADLAHAQLVDELLGRALDAHAVGEEVHAGAHHRELVALRTRPSKTRTVAMTPRTRRSRSPG